METAERMGGKELLLVKRILINFALRTSEQKKVKPKYFVSSGVLEHLSSVLHMPTD